MKRLEELLHDIAVEELAGPRDAAIEALVFDSRAVGQGSCFFAIPGTQCDGHDFIAAALAAGASAVVCERMPAERPEGVAFVRVKDAHGALADAAAAFYGYPRGPRAPGAAR